MRMLEFYAYQSPLSNKHPIEKIGFALFPLLLNIIFQSSYTAILIFFIMATITLVVGKVPIFVYLKLLLIPIALLISSIVVILLSFSMESLDEALFQYSVANIHIGILMESIDRAITLFAVALSSISCLYFLIFTTTIQDILYGLQRCKIPTILLDLIGLTYRFIFVFIESSHTIYLAQKSRLGNGSFFKSLKSVGLIISALFLKVFQQTKELNYAVNARSVNGYTLVITQQFYFSKTSWIFMLLINMLIVVFHLTFGRVV